MNITHITSHAGAYPFAPGFKRRGTSQAAARTTDAGGIRAEVLNTLKIVGPLTPDECADYMRSSVLSVRPRFTELARMGRIVRTGSKRPNTSGKTANVWRCV